MAAISGQRMETKNTAALESASADELALRAELNAERALRATAEQALQLRNTALDAATTLFMIIDANAPLQPIVYANRAQAMLHGYAQTEELVGKSVSLLIDTYGPASKREMLREALREGRAVRIELQVHQPNGSSCWLGISSLPIRTADGKITHFLVLGADITARLEAERKKEQLQHQLVSEMRERERMAIELRLAQKLEAVGRLAAGLAHEINTPTQYVSDSVHFIKTGVEQLEAVSAAYREHLIALARETQRTDVLDKLSALEAAADIHFLKQEIPGAFERSIEGIERVASIVRAMKEFAYPDVGEHSPADLNHALATTLVVARSEYKYAASVATQFGELPQVLCNVSELNQVFLNLIVNAAHAIQDCGKDFSNGHISVTTRTAGEDWVEVLIADNGCGISAENLDRIFDPFFTTKEVGRGTGQGLAIARSIVVEKHGGDIRVQSEVGVGTTFSIRLPVNNRRGEKVTI